jgi:hypothetical protein
MSVVSNPLIGHARQKIGNAVFSTWKGIDVLKTKPISVANPQTDAQTMQRSAFSQMVAAFRLMPSVIRAGFKKLAVKQSEFNAFTSANLKNAFDFTEPPSATFVPGEFIISKGTISATAINTTSFVDGTQIATITWDSSSLQPGQSNTDIAILCVYNQGKNSFAGTVSSTVRTANTADLQCPSDWLL